MCRVVALLLLAALMAAEDAAGQLQQEAGAAPFLGMRDGGAADGLLEKRAPSMGFHGVRGKKDDDLDELDKRAPSQGFHGVRGKKDDASGLADDDDDAFDKRAPTRGFQGVRGKKDDADAEDAELGDGSDYLQLAGLPYRVDYDADGDELQVDDPWLRDEKRALKGFFGTRGKKAPQAGFYGVRGKKGPSSGFYGVRGKKAPLSGFYGVRGKKAPSAGFHGVRGKKDDGASPPDLDSLLYYLNEAGEAARQKRGNTKKAPVGFYGTRGKKSWAPDGGVAPSSDSIASSLVNSQ